MNDPFPIGNGVTEDQYLARFPMPFVVRALTPWEQHRLGLPQDIQQWEFIQPFAYVSDRFGRIEVPAGFVSDFASVPRELHSVVDDDSPQILRASAPHDVLFGRAGRLPDGRTLTFQECNELIVEAMWYCGANEAMRATVFAILMNFGKSHWPTGV